MEFTTEELQQAMLTVIQHLSGHEIQTMAIFEDCYYCPECLKDACLVRDGSWDEDFEPLCKLAWITAAEKITKEKREQNE